MSDIPLKGKIIGFEEYEEYILQDAFGEASPFRLLASSGAPVSFVVVNPFYIVEDYAFELENSALEHLNLKGNPLDHIAILCIVRPNEHTLYVNLRSPLIINTQDGCFHQVILQNEAYGVSVPFVAQKVKSR